eukprot:3452480-Prymnesium_polylepis.1
MVWGARCAAEARGCVNSVMPVAERIHDRPADLGRQIHNRAASEILAKRQRAGRADGHRAAATTYYGRTRADRGRA